MYINDWYSYKHIWYDIPGWFGGKHYFQKHLDVRISSLLQIRGGKRCHALWAPTKGEWTGNGTAFFCFRTKRQDKQLGKCKRGLCYFNSLPFSKLKWHWTFTFSNRHGIPILHHLRTVSPIIRRLTSISWGINGSSFTHHPACTCKQTVWFILLMEEIRLTTWDV